MHANSQNNCVTMFVPGSRQGQDTYGRDGVSRSTDSGQITTMSFWLGNRVEATKEPAGTWLLNYLLGNETTNGATQQLTQISAALLPLSVRVFKMNLQWLNCLRQGCRVRTLKWLCNNLQSQGLWTPKTTTPKTTINIVLKIIRTQVDGGVEAKTKNDYDSGVISLGPLSEKFRRG